MPTMAIMPPSVSVSYKQQGSSLFPLNPTFRPFPRKSRTSRLPLLGSHATTTFVSSSLRSRQDSTPARRVSRIRSLDDGGGSLKSSPLSLESLTTAPPPVAVPQEEEEEEEREEKEEEVVVVVVEEEEEMGEPRVICVGDDLPSGYDQQFDTEFAPRRRAGVLLHPTSLPGPYGIGELGEHAIAFLDWLHTTGCTAWQVLPLVPPGRKSGEDGSPYAGQDANCGNTLLISLDELVKDGLLEVKDLPEILPVATIDHEAVAIMKDPLIAKAAKKLVDSKGPLKDELEEFRRKPEIAGWLEDAALFAAIDKDIDAEFWWYWPVPLRDRHADALEKVRTEQKEFMDIFVAQQFLFQKQWQRIHVYANKKAIKIIGDMPIYVGGHSADVWANRDQFEMDQVTGCPQFVSGVPPDAFSETGQLWGSPLYNWNAMANDGYSWWVRRMKRAFDLFDEFRIDHFRGFAGYWCIKAGSKTAMNGTWKKGPRGEFFKAIKEAVGKIDIIAEDLGVITRDVVSLRKEIGAPGMSVLQFAFGGGATNPYLLHNHALDQVVYSGTHDNDTTLGWWQKLTDEEKDNVKNYLGPVKEDRISWEFIKVAISSVAGTAIVTMQDIMGLDSSARMNTPAVQAGNWGWRVGESGVFKELEKEAEQLHDLLLLYNRISC